MSDLQHKLERALQSASGPNAFSQLVNASLATSAYHFGDLGLVVSNLHPELKFKLSNSRSPGTLISAGDAGDMLQRVQRAVARLARARRFRLPDVARIFPGDLEFARFDVKASLPGSLAIYLTPHSDESDENFSLSPTWAEIGAAELIRALPESSDDAQSIDSILDASPVIRRAVSDLVHHRANPNVDISFSLERRSGETISACLTSRQARSLEENLEVVREEREIINLSGRLDGVRTRRQIFYFEPHGIPEIHGFVDDSLVNAVKEYLGAEVDLKLESFIIRSSSGRSGQRRYRLIEVAGYQTELPPSNDSAEESTDTVS